MVFDIVKLKSGGPKMIIINKDPTYICQWFHEEELFTGKFIDSSLDLVNIAKTIDIHLGCDDMVKLKSGGPEMRVTGTHSVPPSKELDRHCTCEWFHEGKKCTELFLEFSLEKSNNASPKGIYSAIEKVQKELE